MIGDKYKDFCFNCDSYTMHKHISNNKWNNPVYECLGCGQWLVDKINEEDGI